MDGGPEIRHDGITISKRTLVRIGIALVLVLVAAGAYGVGHGSFGSSKKGTRLALREVRASAVTTTTRPEATTTTSSSTSTTTTSTTTVAPTTTTTVRPTMTPQAVVQAFYADVNQDRFEAAWNLQTGHFQGVVGPYSSWVAGYGGTANDQLTVAASLGDEVDISLDATQSDGSQQTYQGVYYVHDGLISGADVAEVSDTPGPWCSVTVDPSYDGWGDIEVNVTSNQPSEPISISTAEDGATATLTSSTDGSGDAAAVYPAANEWAQGYTVNVTVVAGESSCSTSFTP